MFSGENGWIMGIPWPWRRRHDGGHVPPEPAPEQQQPPVTPPVPPAVHPAPELYMSFGEPEHTLLSPEPLPAAPPAGELVEVWSHGTGAEVAVVNVPARHRVAVHELAGIPAGRSERTIVDGLALALHPTADGGIEVGWRGRRIGTLDPMLSSLIWPTVHELQARGLTPWVPGSLDGMLGSGAPEDAYDDETGQWYGVPFGTVDPFIRAQIFADRGMWFPANRPPEHAVVLPVGRAITLRDTPVESVAGFLSGGRQQVLVWVALVEGEDGTVHALLDGQDAGHTTKPMASKLRGAIRAMDGRPVLTRAVVRGNSMEALMIVYPARTVDIPEAWTMLPDEPPATPQL